MRKYVIRIALIMSILLIGGCSIVNQETIYFQNPISDITNIGDPFILKDNGKYYMFATSAPSYGFNVWESKNLVDWEERGLAYDHIDMENQWGIGDFWAPEVIKKDETFYMTYSARNSSDSLRIAIATSDSPTGPFVDANIDLIKEDGSFIDGHIFIDEDGTPYFYYVKDNYENIIDRNHVSQIYVQKMTEDLLGLTGPPECLLEPSQDWEDPTGKYQWNEGPFVIKYENIYYLMYSANYFGGEYYAIGYATSTSPMGPFEKSEKNPILSSNLDQGISGPGHNSVTVGLDNKTLYAVYHIHTDPENPSGDRSLAIDRLYFEEGEMKIDGPTSTVQELQ